MAHLLIAATHKSSGKTTIATGLAAALARRGLAVQPFKKGPDYIDPMWLGRAAGRPCRNLDFHTMTDAEIVATFCMHDHPADISLIEANKGLFDGLDVEGRDSNAALAAKLGAPIVLVVDTLGMTRGIAPLLLGYQGFDTGIRIEGVILNKVGGPRHESKLRAAVEHYTDLQVLGAIGRDESLEIPERHLGLVPANESGEADEVIDRLAKTANRALDLERIVEIAGGAQGPCIESAVRRRRAPVPTDIRIGVARDAAFGFYYPDDLDALAAAGAELIPFDTLTDTALPNVDALFVGGGFPETQMAALEANRGLRLAIRTALAAGMPAYAECGGMMYLSRSLSWNGETREMVGAIPADAVMHHRPQGRGYVVLQETGQSPWAGNPDRAGAAVRFPAHEFHYASLEGLPPDRTFAYEVLRGHGIDGRHDGIVLGNLLASFSHLRDTEGNRWAERFAAFVRSCRRAAGARKASPRR